ncbi:MAG: hypothetical protein AAFW95_11155, partial [Cyanobacteria bacterium J06638_6]
MLESVALGGVLSQIYRHGRQIYEVAQQGLVDDDDAFASHEARLREVQHIDRVGDWEFEITTGHMRWSPEPSRILGQDPARLDPTFEAFL